MGTQDDFPLATDFVERGGIETPAMLWDPSFVTWQALGVRTNSQMMLVSPDLTAATDLIYGFNEAQQDAIIEALPSLAGAGVSS